MALKLFQAESFAMRVKELADELFKDERWEGMYSDIGKAARSPKIMAIALILQQHRNLSDRQMERATRYDLEVKAALGLPVDHPGIPLNGKIYFHSAKSGHKIDAITKNSKISFSVIDEDTIASERYTTFFRSVISLGKARIVEGDEWLEAFEALVEKYSGDQPKEAKQKEITGCT